jgi:hypothetical protein
VDSLRPADLEALGHDPHQPILKYVDHPDCPAEAPIDHPHILKDVEEGESLDTINCSAVRLCDAVVTLLHHLEPQDGSLIKDFFGRKDSPRFQLIRQSYGDKEREMNLFIARKSSDVIVSWLSSS